MTTTHVIDLHFQPLHTAEEILSTLYTQTNAALEQNPNWINGFCFMYLPVNENLTIKAKVFIDVPTQDVRYFVTSSLAPKAKVAPMTYTQAVREIRSYLAQ